MENVDELDAVIERDLGVLGGGDALDGERDLEFALDALDCLPIEGFLKVTSARPPPAAGDVALGDVALAPAVMRGVDGQAERRVFVGDGARDEIVDPGGVAAHVELKDTQGVWRSLGTDATLKTRIAHRRQHVELTPEFRRRLGDRRGAPSGWKLSSEPTGHSNTAAAELAAENVRRGVDLADVAQHARAECDGVERHPIAPQRRFGFDAADDVIPGVLVQILPRLVDDLMQVHEVGAGRQIRQSGCFVGFFAAHRDTRRSLRPSGLEGTLRLQGRAATVQGRWGRIKKPARLAASRSRRARSARDSTAIRWRSR